MKLNEIFLNDIADEIISKKNSKEYALKKTKRDSYVITEVTVKTSKNSIGKEKGHYITIECENDHHNEKVLSEYLKKILKLNGYKTSSRILVAGLGNDSYLSDALGPKVVKNIKVTSHILDKSKQIHYVSCFIPGVLAITGLESSSMIKSIIDSFDIDILIVIDSLATRNVSRLYKTYQVTDTGINPGSGIKNNRLAINKKIMGIPVVAIGVATVVDTASIVINALNMLDNNAIEKIDLKDIYRIFAREKYNLIMTTKEIDELIDVIALNIAQGINLTLNPRLANNDNFR